MLTMAIVENYMDEFTKVGYPKWRKFRLCYEKSGRLNVLAMIGEKITSAAFTDFINGQENLSEDMLRRYQYGAGKRIRLGTRRELIDGTIREYDMETNVKKVTASLVEAITVLSK